MIYAGIGSRDCPKDILNLIVKTSYWLAKKGYILRSGAADGCDKAFEYGCDKATGKKEIYLPWKGFNGSTSDLVVTNQEAFNIANKYHPNFKSLKEGAQKLQARNSHQILGWNLDEKVDFVICYTKDGLAGGGTGQALRIANDLNIPIFDFGKFKDINEMRENFKLFIEPFLSKN